MNNRLRESCDLIRGEILCLGSPQHIRITWRAKFNLSVSRSNPLTTKRLLRHFPEALGALLALELFLQPGVLGRDVVLEGHLRAEGLRALGAAVVPLGRQPGGLVESCTFPGGGGTKEIYSVSRI